MGFLEVEMLISSRIKKIKIITDFLLINPAIVGIEHADDLIVDLKQAFKVSERKEAYA